MNKKIIIFTALAIFIVSFLNFTYATDIVMDLNRSSDTSSTQNTSDTTDTETNTTDTSDEYATVDNTIYSSNPDATEDVSNVQEPTVTTTTSEEESTDLSITNIINIILIVVGVVLILLGIAIIIKLK